MGWSSQYKHIKNYFVVHIYDKGNIFCEIKELQKACSTRKEALDYAKRVCDKTTRGYHIENYAFAELDLSEVDLH